MAEFTTPKKGGAAQQLNGDDLPEWDADLRSHRQMLRAVIEQHREGGGNEWAQFVGEEDEFALEEKPEFPPISALHSKFPPEIVQGASGWIYH